MGHAHIERIDPADQNWLYYEHLSRYKFASRYAISKLVLDTGCGAGYGTHYLSDFAARVIGIDLSEEAIEKAESAFKKDNLEFMRMDCTALDFEGGMFDAVCSFEVLEHIGESDIFLSEIKRVLADDGVIMLSTPNKAVQLAGRDNPHHVREYYMDELHELLSRHFRTVELYGEHWTSPVARFKKLAQHNVLIGRINSLLTATRRAVMPKTPSFLKKGLEDSYPITRDSVEKAPVFVAVCRA
jgi:SAM-dependent methyltransferase